ncbi:MAG: hypothetical protein ACXWQR_00335 [Ktedonobacterales bacterium]
MTTTADNDGIPMGQGNSSIVEAFANEAGKRVDAESELFAK